MLKITEMGKYYSLIKFLKIKNHIFRRHEFCKQSDMKSILYEYMIPVRKKLIYN
jgi:hypothetical protein